MILIVMSVLSSLTLNSGWSIVFGNSFCGIFKANVLTILLCTLNYSEVPNEHWKQTTALSLFHASIVFKVLDETRRLRLKTVRSLRHVTGCSKLKIKSTNLLLILDCKSLKYSYNYFLIQFSYSLLPNAIITFTRLL